MSGRANRIATCLLVIVGGLLAGCSGEDTAENKSPAKAEGGNPAETVLEPVRKDVRIIVEDEVAALPEETDVIQRLPSAQSADERNAAQTARLPSKPTTFPRPLVRGANEIVSGEVTIQLSGIDAPSQSLMCERADGSKWPCGNFAKASLQRLIRARTISCEGEYLSDTVFSGSCMIGNIDVARWLVEQGWAEATDQHLKDVGQAAKQAGKGIWQR